MRRFAHRNIRDANHKKIVGYYEDLGIGVVDLADVGKGCPDLLVHAFGISDLVEIKTEDGELEDSQIEFNQIWKGAKIHLVRDMYDVVDHVKSMTERRQ